MAGYSALDQTVNPGETVVFTITDVACAKGFVRHRNGTGEFVLSGYVPNQPGVPCCMRQRAANYLVTFTANVGIPTGETVSQISLAITVNGITDTGSTMIASPSAVEQFENVSRTKYIDIFKGCCESVAVRNTSTIPILVQNANIVFSRPDLYASR